MKELQPSISLDVLSGLFGITRQAYNKQRQQKVTEVLEQDIILDLVKKVRQRLHSCGGRLLLDKIKEGLDVITFTSAEMPFLIYFLTMDCFLKRGSEKFIPLIPITG